MTSKLAIIFICRKLPRSITYLWQYAVLESHNMNILVPYLCGLSSINIRVVLRREVDGRIPSSNANMDGNVHAIRKRCWSRSKTGRSFPDLVACPLSLVVHKMQIPQNVLAPVACHEASKISRRDRTVLHHRPVSCKPTFLGAQHAGNQQPDHV
eukprot:jgi/Phyca11/98215/e_gw1.2.1340.1